MGVVCLSFYYCLLSPCGQKRIMNKVVATIGQDSFPSKLLLKDLGLLVAGVVTGDECIKSFRLSKNRAYCTHMALVLPESV